MKNYTVPFVQLDPLKTILVFSHQHNTFDKRTLLENIGSNQYIKYSSKEVGDFIKDKDIIRFFLEEMDEKLKIYEQGDINMKPDVLKQIKELELKRKELEKKMMEERKKNTDSYNGSENTTQANKNSTGTIVLQEEGKPPRELNYNEVVEMLTLQQKQLLQMNHLKELYGTTMRENVRLKEIVETQQKILDEKNVYISDLETKIVESSEIIVVDVEKH